METTIEVLSLAEDAQRSIARVVIHGINQRTINHLSATTYHVLCGTGTMEIAGEIHELREGVSVKVPAGTPYHDEGDLVLLATSEPPFDSNFVETLT